MPSLASLRELAWPCSPIAGGAAFISRIMNVKWNLLMLVSDDDDTSSRAEGYFELRLPRRRLYCRCGHQLTAYDFDILEPSLVRAVCSRCHSDLFTLETR
jgi:hypothetical protein